MVFSCCSRTVVNMNVFLNVTSATYFRNAVYHNNGIRLLCQLSSKTQSGATCRPKLYCRTNLKVYCLFQGLLRQNHLRIEPKIRLLGKSSERSFCQVHKRQFFSSSKSLNNSALDVNTNVVKDVILFRYENPKFYRLLNVFAICQFFFWGYLSHFAFTSLKDIPITEGENNEDLPWWRKTNLGENKYRYGITFVSFAIGYGILAGAWTFTLRSVRFLVLRKGGDSITFVTYGPFGKNRMVTAPIGDVSCQEGRQVARVQLPIKVKKSPLYFVLDMRGEFTNPRLFDHTAGLKRVFRD